ncbi:TPA: hypothetical protein JBF21_07050 [Legionella pneumophila]|nr:hypothetical protein [Legionella pneumophila]HBD7428631.1 hypothetical protein [Legionella pneumophila]HBD7471188.1 hypothetical protein [Legionella pneumophila]
MCLGLKLPSDYQILKAIYKLYLKEFINYSNKEKARDNKVYVPIDCKKIAEHLNVDPDMVFGRLHYYLTDKYSYKKNDGSMVYLFTTFELKEKNCINFPLMTSILAGMYQDKLRFNLSTWVSIGGAILSLGAALFNLN